jgi:flagellin-like hook-associated protein FlgL
MTVNISFLGQSNAQISRLKTLNVNLADLQRQLASQKKFEDLSGYGLDAGNVQRARIDRNRLKGYLENVTSGTNRIKLLNTNLTKSSDIARDLLSSLRSVIREGDVDTTTIKSQATANLAFLQDIMNSNVEGRYIFAGSNVGTAPIQNTSTLDSNVQADYQDWLSGTQTTAQLLATLDSAGIVYQGLDPALTTAGPVTMRFNDSVELDYTSLADENGMKELQLALSVATRLQQPGTGDTPTRDEFFELMDKVIEIAESALRKLDAANGVIAGRAELASKMQEAHEQDIGVLETLIANKETPDINEVAIKIQTLQTQLQASYQVTASLRELSLVNFI